MCISLSLSLGQMEQLWFSPCSVEQEGSENPASWLDDMLGDTLLNCFDRCATNVTIKNLSLLKYTSGSQPVKYRCNVQYVCYVRTVWFSLCVCVWHRLLLCVSLKCHCTLLGNVWLVLCFVYHAWNEAVSSFILLKYLSPSRCTSGPVLANISFI